MPRKRRQGPLTTRQRAVLDAIRNWIRDHGYPPTIRELGALLGIRSLRGVTTHLDAIAKKGFLVRHPRARSITLPDLLKPFERAVRVPVIGRIRAGEPLLAEQAVEDHLVVDGAWINASAAGESQHFALKVIGDSMIGAGILEGDYVIVRQQAAVDAGEIVVALLGEEATVKRYFKDGAQVRLQPEHPNMEPILVSPSQPLQIMGKVVAVFRHLS